MKLNFRSDASISGNGFRLEWVVDGCGGVIRKPSGQIMSPNYPNVYPGLFLVSATTVLPQVIPIGALVYFTY